jgi:hypothetical protein
MLLKEYWVQRVYVIDTHFQNPLEKVIDAAQPKDLGLERGTLGTNPNSQ